MPRSSSPYVFEQITGEIIFSHLTASICQAVILPKSKHRPRTFVPTTVDNRLASNYAKEFLFIGQHPKIKFEKLEADLFFRFSFDQTPKLHIPPELEEVLFTIVDDLFAKLLQLESLSAFCTARHIRQLLKYRPLSLIKHVPADLAQIIENMRSIRSKEITDSNMRTITSITLSCLNSASFSMPVNQKSEIVELLSNANTSGSTEECKFYFLNALLNTGRLLLYYANNMEQGWRASVLTSMVWVCKGEKADPGYPNPIKLSDPHWLSLVIMNCVIARTMMIQDPPFPLVWIDDNPINEPIDVFEIKIALRRTNRMKLVYEGMEREREK
ncbi:hypothetical protein I4U23_000509 [Adineta vaga]|nr:hypothetical protein I4U23_000509 [Adineta vaga]